MVQKVLDITVREKFFKVSRNDGQSPRDPVFQLLLAPFHRKIILMDGGPHRCTLID